MARTDQQTDQALTEAIAAYEHNLEQARIVVMVQGVALDAVTDPTQKAAIAAQILGAAADIAAYQTAITKLATIAGKPASGNALRNRAQQAIDAAKLVPPVTPPRPGE